MPNELQISALAASRLPAKQLDVFRNYICQFNKDRSSEKLPTLPNALAERGILEAAERDLKAWERQGISFVALGETAYPAALAQIYKPPLYLTYKGEFPSDLHSRKTIAIVGSRRSDVEGEKIATSFAAALAASGVCIVSGLALGIDACAHRGALQAATDFPTIAVLGNGLDTVYPPSNRDLADNILARGGLLISQFPVGERAYPGNFLDRNRVIAALAQAVVVIQAGERSGSLVTARFALELGKEVLVVPGSILGQRYVGSNKLIKQGATPLTSAQDVLEAMGEIWKVGEGALGEIACENSALPKHPVLSLLKQCEKLTVSELTNRLGQPKNLQSELFALEMQGLIERRPGNIIALK